MPVKGSTKSTKDPVMVAEQRLNSMEGSIETLEEAVINLNGLKSEIEQSLAEMVKISLDSIHKSITEATKSQVKKIDKLMETVQLTETLANAQKEMEQKFQLLESNINKSLENIKQNGIKTDASTSDASGHFKYKDHLDSFRKAYRIADKDKWDDKDKSKFPIFKIKIFKLIETGPNECLRMMKHAETPFCTHPSICPGSCMHVRTHACMYRL